MSELTGITGGATPAAAPASRPRAAVPVTRTETDVAAAPKPAAAPKKLEVKAVTAEKTPPGAGDASIVPPEEITTETIQRMEEKRLETLEYAAAEYTDNDLYPVSDVTFTIFKDGSGEYITRFRSLRDGTVKYIPEPDVLNKSFMKHGVNPGAMLKTEA